MITERCPPPDWGEGDEGEANGSPPVALAERVEYLMTLASLTDGALTPRGAARLLELCRDLEIPDEEVDQVLAVARRVGIHS